MEDKSNASKYLQPNIYIIVLDEDNNKRGYFKLKEEGFQINKGDYLKSFGFEENADILISSEEETSNPNTILKHALKSVNTDLTSYKCIARGEKGNCFIFIAKINKDIDIKSFFDKIKVKFELVQEKEKLLKDEHKKEELKLLRKEFKLSNKKLKNYNIKIKRLKLKALRLSKKFSKLEVTCFILSIFITCISGLLTFITYITSKKDQAFYILVLSFALGCFLGLFKFLNFVTKKLILITDFISYRKSIYLEEVPNSEKEKIIQDCVCNMSEKYKKFNRVIYTSAKSKSNKMPEKEVFIYSKEENQNLELRAKEIRIKKDSRKHFVQDNSLKALAAIVNEKLKQDKVIFNGKLLGILSELNFGKTKEFYIKNVRYYDYISCDELIYKNIFSLQDSKYIFEGKKMSFHPLRNGLKDIEKSALTNLIGINLIVKLKTPNKNYFIVNEQSSYNDVNRKKLVPSASGSAEKEDYKNIISNKKYYLEDLLKESMLRELKEESFLKGDVVEHAKFKLLGFSRLVSKGGKPDFFGLLEIEDTTSPSQVLKIFNEEQNKRIGKKVIRFPLESGEMLLISENDFLKTSGWEKYASAQLRYIKDLLNDTLK